MPAGMGYKIGNKTYKTLKAYKAAKKKLAPKKTTKRRK